MPQNYSYMHRSNSDMQLACSKQGFTLLELMLYVSIASSVLLLAAMTTISIVDVQMKNFAISEIEQQGTHALFTVLSAIRNSEAVTYPGPGVSSSTMILNVYPASEDPTRFEVLNGQLRMTRALTPPLSLSGPTAQVTSFMVSNVSRPATPGSARVRITMRFVNPSGKQSYNYSRTFIGTASLGQP